MTTLSSPAPYGGGVSLPYGATSPPYSKAHPHAGIDYAWLKSDPAGSQRIVAPVGGVVTAAYNDGRRHDGWGNYIDITVSRQAFIRLAHHATGSVTVRPGDRVSVGQSIARMGNTGDAIGVHSHLEVWIDGRRVDPAYYFTHDLPGTPATADTGPLTPIPEDDMPLTDADISKIAAAVWDRQIASEDNKTTYTAGVRLRGINLVVDEIVARVRTIEGDARKSFDAVTPGVLNSKPDGVLYALVKSAIAGGASIDYDKLADAIVRRVLRA